MAASEVGRGCAWRLEISANPQPGWLPHGGRRRVRIRRVKPDEAVHRCHVEQLMLDFSSSYAGM